MPNPEQGNIAIFAGRGSLPRAVAQGLVHRGNRVPYLIGIEGEHESWIYDYEHVVLHWGQFGGLFKFLKNNNITQMLFAGAMNRPSISNVKMDLVAIKTLPQIMAFIVGGDNSMLSGVIKVFENRGIQIVGAHQIIPELLASRGLIAGRKPSRKALANMEKAFEASKLLGSLDIGQAAVAVGKRVVAVEGIEGTDQLLARVADLRKSGRLTEDGTHGVLVKTMKPKQDMRVDLPAIGPDTIQRAFEAGLAGVAVEAEKSFILDRQETISLAKKLGIFIHGLD